LVSNLESSIITSTWLLLYIFSPLESILSFDCMAALLRFITNDVLSFSIFVILQAYSTVGTPDYIAPEVILKRGYGVECDWYNSICFLLLDFFLFVYSFLQYILISSQCFQVVSWSHNVWNACGVSAISCRRSKDNV